MQRAEGKEELEWALRGRLDLKNPPTPVGGILSPDRSSGRLELKDPPTAVGGITALENLPGRLRLKCPMAPVGGIQARTQRFLLRSSAVERIPPTEEGTQL
jgi:hypothetical protein